ncbi:hypothetical protein LX97_00987 [Nonlabens dokdonensis]|uniref:Membrane or secreted protein n=2 Tax=Nonlabens dokdonensis TaxID=328515 RepID=L7W424_NONDD|nr:hypothetical protein [Nonlabens dokdonensis]AGC76320.1 membrane or secreted protein [Nonlabens dokdonensis DSW-6]PZX43982.1 hypothetical protein LX97_00987 [Nonlabens dokdonensis]
MINNHNYFLLTILLVLSIVSCSNDNNDSENVVELIPVESEVVFFQYTSDTGNNTSRLQYEIEFTNLNSIPVNGFYKITTNVDGSVSTSFSSTQAQCNQIGANSTCTYSLDGEESHNTGIPNSITITDVSYEIVESDN